MGFNATVVVMNDALHAIEQDVQFGAKLARAVSEQYGRHENVDVSAMSHVNAATVIGVHHADEMHLFAVGGNTGYDFGYQGNYRSKEEELLKSWAEKLGYVLHKKPAKRAKR